MATKDDEFLKRLLATFRDEAKEHLQALSAGLFELEQADPASQAGIVERVFREAHTLKGAARAVNLTEIVSVCQSLESVFAALKRGQLAVSSALCDLLQEAMDDLTTLLSEQGAAMAVAGKSMIDMLNRRLAGALKGSAPIRLEPGTPQRDPVLAAFPSESATEHTTGRATESSAPPQAPAASETVRIATAKLNAAMRQTEELLVPKLAAEQRIRDLRETGMVLAAWQKQRAAIRPFIRLLERSSAQASGTGSAPVVGKLLKYLEQEESLVRALGSRIEKLGQDIEHDGRALNGAVDTLLQDMREMLMMPLNTLFDTFPHAVRELARDQQKEVELAMHGGELEIDRRVIEELKTPLLHLLRNCIDHGIEKPSLRTERHKPSGGRITLAVSQQDSGKAEIVVSDDGAGIDIERVKAVAAEQGVIAAEDAKQFGEREALDLIFRSGISTSSIITDISGRGLGLAIVREKIERLGGTVSVSSTAGRGASFHMTVPLTLATFRGVLVRVRDRLMVLPLRNVERVLRVECKEIRNVENRETISHGGKAVSLVHLGDVLEIPRGRDAGGTGDWLPVIMLGSGDASIAFGVDEISGEQEVMVKMLGSQLERVRNVAGACILGDGRVVPVLNPHDLMKSAVQQARGMPLAATEDATGKRQRSLLVVEDSITSRALLKNILESAGYLVTTAVDGLDAYTALKTGAFDLIVSDVEMPRMDGFDLTAKVRADKQLAELPVVLVTALESREHRERGIDAGANAYIVKSSFDQSNLLDVIGRLI